MKLLFRKQNIILLFIIMIATTTTFSKREGELPLMPAEKKSMYEQMNLSKSGLSNEVFDKAFKGWKSLFEKHLLENPNLLSIADLSQSSNSKRLYVIDMVNRKLLFNTFVAHGRNSGEEYAQSFSNKLNSYQSSLGFYIAENTYQSAHGLAMRLKGIEKGINDEAEERGIVMHGAPYVSESFIHQYGRLGRSQGCPAVPEELCKPIINSIKGGSCFFMFYPDKNYLQKSSML